MSLPLHLNLWVKCALCFVAFVEWKRSDVNPRQRDIQAGRTDNSRLSISGMAKAEKSSRESSKRIAGNFAKAGAAGLAIGAGIGFGLLKVGKGAFALEKQFAEVSTLLDKSLGDTQKEVISLANELGMVASDVVPALYQAISAGVPKSNVIDFLRTAGHGAVGGVTDLTTAVDGITGVVNAYSDATHTAERVNDLMFTAVRLGKTNYTTAL